MEDPGPDMFSCAYFSLLITIYTFSIENRNKKREGERKGKKKKKIAIIHDPSRKSITYQHLSSLFSPSKYEINLYLLFFTELVKANISLH